MADTYIDYLEAGEYGDHFIEESKKLDGLWPGVDVEAVRAEVGAAVAAVDAELGKVGIKRGSLREDRKGTKEKAAAARKEIERFYNYLGSLDDDVYFDWTAFFPGGNLGALAALKPADVKARLGDIARGFSVAANSALPDKDKWQGKIEKASTDLGTALASKGSATASSIVGTAGLTAARAQFLVTYNGVAKPIIQGLLTKLGRKEEMRLFFKDLQVNEAPTAKKPAAEGAPSEGANGDAESPPEGSVG